MRFYFHPGRLTFGLVLLASLSCIAVRAADRPQSAAKPVLLYSLYYNAPGENRYAPTGVYSDVLSRLAQDFEVRVSAAPMTPQLLSTVRVLMICNPNDKAFGTNPPPPHVTEEDVVVLTRFVEDGGGMILMGNQDNHNLEVPDMNRLLARFGMHVMNLYTDAKKLVLPPATPMIGGLRWAFYSGNLVLIDRSHRARPQAVVSNDLSQSSAAVRRDQPGILLARAQPGKGRIIVVTDSGWIANWAFNEQGAGGNVIEGQDNWEILHRLARWVARLTD